MKASSLLALEADTCVSRTAIDLLTKTLTISDVLENPERQRTVLPAALTPPPSALHCRPGHHLSPGAVRISYLIILLGILNAKVTVGHILPWRFLSLERLLDPVHLTSAKAAAELCWEGGAGDRVQGRVLYSGGSCSVSSTPCLLCLPLISAVSL